MEIAGNETIPKKSNIPIARMVALAAIDAGLILTYYYLMTHPDAVVRLQMRAALIVKRGSLRLSDKLRTVSDNAATHYNLLRNTNV